MQQNKIFSFFISLLSSLKILLQKLFINGCYLIGAAKQKDLKINQLKQYDEGAKDGTVFEEWLQYKHSYAPTVSVSSIFLKFMLKRNWVKLLWIILLTTTLNIIVFYRPIALENLLNIGKNGGKGSGQYVYIAYYVGFEFLRTSLREINSLQKIEVDLRFRTSIKALVYGKVLKLSSASRKYLEGGVLHSYYN